tara:strand:+ start:702 stop:1040 length:339 start_codon:yes stop_codon:yes gene_type:complete
MKKNFVKRLPRRKDDYFIPGGVKVHKPQELEIALRIFKRHLKETGKLQELRDRRYFEKPSAKRREIMDKAKNQQKKDNRIQKFKSDSMVWAFPDINYVRKARPKRRKKTFSR